MIGSGTTFTPPIPFFCAEKGIFHDHAGRPRDARYIPPG